MDVNLRYIVIIKSQEESSPKRYSDKRTPFQFKSITVSPSSQVSIPVVQSARAPSGPSQRYRRTTSSLRALMSLILSGVEAALLDPICFPASSYRQIIGMFNT